MINRVLIRIKVIQLLYSYLLTNSGFSLPDLPTSPTREKRFAHQIYLDTLILIFRISDRIEKRGGEKPLMDNRLIRIISENDQIRSLIAKYRVEGFVFNTIIDLLSDEIKNSAIYKKYLKKEDRQMADDINFWQQIFDLIISRNSTYLSIISSIPNHTMGAVDKMKVLMEQTFNEALSSPILLTDAKRQLEKSLYKTRELYFRLLLLPIEITKLRDRHIDENRHKHLPTSEDLNPNMKFIENRLVADMAADSMINEFINKEKISWLSENQSLISSLLRDIMESEYYRQYMDSPESSYNLDVELWKNLYKNVIFNSELFLETLEDKSIFWNDDIDITSTFILKTLKRFQEKNEGILSLVSPVLPMYKDQEDATFGTSLFGYVASNYTEYHSIIDESLRKETWDTDRLAFMDVIIMVTAIAEMLNFPKIPIKVTMNEYIEMAKSYSSYKSGIFINGILGDIISRLKDSGKLNKTE